ncbi:MULTISPECIES: winged helix-turn-helix transcriptional regulator [Mesoplasma]|uniref:Transcriptional regulator, marR family n=2 Tax=Mesoplasma florum TaxID=2151 RepID=Q6F266_MESFL|nr:MULTISPECIES: helix-turn-helix domain-containing protein [Mesoplasma]AAT75407.1 transcriptional regulator, marR family [Mesoplasma florum L1]AGY41122.1 Transcriptional regulator, HxlR family [Mesoplasma florum W37]ATI73008.1 transcriptional regulator [Mesoplasma florum]ATI73698.1 transcriptional regulator [Mesoplasma florum]AVN58663.1 transcriptional regulator [Mesoplasma florum]
MEKFCPLEYTLNFIKSKWVILIIRELSFGTCRFNELEKRIAGISQKVLTSNLRFLEENKLVERTVYPVVPPKVEYSLTDLGKSLKPILDQMSDWGVKNYGK